MYKKTVLIASIFLISGCSDFGKELSATLVDSIKAGFNTSSTREKATKKQTQEHLTKNEKIWNNCMEKNRKKHSRLFYGKALEVVAENECNKELGNRFKMDIDIEKRKHAPDREKRINSCISKLSKFSYVRNPQETCNTLGDLTPYQQCVQEYVFIDIDKGVTSSGIKIDDVRCRSLKN